MTMGKKKTANAPPPLPPAVRVAGPSPKSLPKRTAGVQVLAQFADEAGVRGTFSARV
jgi:hypothetical protein